MSGNDRGLPRFGKDKKRAGELSDAELRTEIERRQTPTSASAQAAQRTARDDVLPPREFAQYLANLELAKDASPADIEAAYERLLVQYTPGLEASGAERREATELLLRSLGRARDALLRHMSRRV